MGTFDFGEALRRLKSGGRVARDGWNGKGMWLLLVPAKQWSASAGPSHVPGAHRLPWIGMKTVDGGLVPWVASQTDMLAEDWIDVHASSAAHILINGTHVMVGSGELTYEDIVSLAGLKNTPSVTYTRGTPKKPCGMLDPGDVVPVVDGMIINAVTTVSA